LWEFQRNEKPKPERADAGRIWSCPGFCLRSARSASLRCDRTRRAASADTPRAVNLKSQIPNYKQISNPDDQNSQPFRCL